MLLADFHIHTTWSDGAALDREVVDLFGRSGQTSSPSPITSSTATAHRQDHASTRPHRDAETFRSIARRSSARGSAPWTATA